MVKKNFNSCVDLSFLDPENFRDEGGQNSFLLTYFNNYTLKYLPASFVFINKKQKPVNDRTSKNN